MKDLLTVFILGVLFAAMFFFVMMVSAHHPEIGQQAGCDGWEIVGTYIGGSQQKRLEWEITYTVDGITQTESGDWEGQSDGFEVFFLNGSQDNIVATGYLRQLKKKDDQWVFEREETVALSFQGNCTTPTITLSTAASASATPTATQAPEMTQTPIPGPTSTPQPEPTQTPIPATSQPLATPKGVEVGVIYGNK